jgi:hypothetical protein
VMAFVNEFPDRLGMNMTATSLVDCRNDVTRSGAFSSSSGSA